VHNSFYFRKEDNAIEDPEAVEETMREFIRTLLRSHRSRARSRMKDWFRAYINLGLLHHVQGQQRPLECTAGTDAFFLEPHGRILACNGSAVPFIMGDLTRQDFDGIWDSPEAEEARKKVASCTRQCWMTGTAVPAMKKHPLTTLSWVIGSKLRLRGGKDIIFDGTR